MLLQKMSVPQLALITKSKQRRLSESVSWFHTAENSMHDTLVVTADQSRFCLQLHKNRKLWVLYKKMMT